MITGEPRPNLPAASATLGAPVSRAGVRIGRVEAISFDPNDYRAVVALNIESSFDRIPDDSDASMARWKRRTSTRSRLASESST